MKDILLIATGGAAGAVCRYLGSGLMYRMFGGNFPYGTLFVNVIGCLLIGFFMQLSLSTEIFSRDIRPLFAIGFLGAFTTFSTFGYETFRYMLDGEWVSLALNITANIFLCMLAVWAGWSAGRAML